MRTSSSWGDLRTRRRDAERSVARQGRCNPPGTATECVVAFRDVGVSVSACGKTGSRKNFCSGERPGGLEHATDAPATGLWMACNVDVQNERRGGCGYVGFWWPCLEKHWFRVARNFVLGQDPGCGFRSVAIFFSALPPAGTLQKSMKD